jgi:hypothetical protein
MAQQVLQLLSSLLTAPVLLCSALLFVASLPLYLALAHAQAAPKEADTVWAAATTTLLHLIPLDTWAATPEG